MLSQNCLQRTLPLVLFTLGHCHMKSKDKSNLFLLVFWILIHLQYLLSAQRHNLYAFLLFLTEVPPPVIPQLFPSLAFLHLCSLCLFSDSLSPLSLENTHCPESPHLNSISFPKASKAFESWSLLFKIIQRLVIFVLWIVISTYQLV